MATPRLTATTRPIKGDDAEWKREKDAQIVELQNAIKNLSDALDNQNRRT